MIEAAAILLKQSPHWCKKFKIIIYGRPDIHIAYSLKRMIHNNNLHEIFEWRPEYSNEKIITRVFNFIDCIIVPSIWDENSPLVIHEALQCKIPVITSSQGGMSELIQNGLNGLTFSHRFVHIL